MNAVTSAFDAAAGTYEQAAGVQRTVARALAGRIRALPLARNPRILEIGCGTGFLTRALAGLGGDIIASDISEAMLRRCDAARRVVMDGGAPCFARGFDLVCSSLAFQWLGDLPRAIAACLELLEPGGHLAFATLGRGTFAEWDAAFARPARGYPSRAALNRVIPAGSVVEERIVRRYATGRDFLHRLRLIGAHRLDPGNRPLPAGALRRVLRDFDGGIAVTYCVLYAVVKV